MLVVRVDKDVRSWEAWTDGARGRSLWSHDVLKRDCVLKARTAMARRL